jgi:Family of unknown function (DUF1028)/Invasin, domain 3
MSKSRSVRFAVTALAMALLVTSATPTWSIVVVNTKTREVCVGTATCIEGFDIQTTVPVLIPEYGAGASQATVDSSGICRKRIFRGCLAERTPQDILNSLATIGGHQSRQFGIANFFGPPVTFTGNNASQAKGGVAAEVGDLRYAIQGNILVDPIVWLSAEQALVNTPGDLSQKVMAAMEAARSWGGDGRCSCTTGPPTSCGAPPPAPFKSAHCAFVGIARVGDTLGTCTSAGCATGHYFMSLDFAGVAADPDPVIVLQGMYTTWRQGLQGRPDQILSIVDCQADSLVADGKSSTQVEIQLVDIDGVPLTTGGAQFTVSLISQGLAASVPGPIIDHGNGTYSLTLTASTTPGLDTWRIQVTDAVGPVVLQPDVQIRVDPLAPLHVGLDQLSVSAGGSAPFTLNAGASQAGAPFVLLGSTSGTQPGTSFSGLNVPLNADRLFNLMLFAQPPLLVGSPGLLDADGRASVTFSPSPDLLLSMAGLHSDWAAAILGGSPTAIGPVGLELVP